MVAEDMLKSGHLRQWRSELQLPIVDQYFEYFSADYIAMANVE